MSAFVKICGMTSDAAVTAAVDAGADAIGFVFFDKSPRNLSPARAATLAADLPSSIRKVAVTLHPEPDLWSEIQQLFKPDVLQTDAADFAVLDVHSSIEKWPVLREGALPATMPGVFVYEGTKSGQGQTVDWNVAARIAGQGRMILAGGLTAGNVGDAIKKVAPWGVDVSSAVESAPGIKDPAMIRAFIEAARAAG